MCDTPGVKSSAVEKLRGLFFSKKRVSFCDRKMGTNNLLHEEHCLGY